MAVDLTGDMGEMKDIKKREREKSETSQFNLFLKNLFWGGVYSMRRDGAILRGVLAFNGRLSSGGNACFKQKR
jgi:hypothetical protein